MTELLERLKDKSILFLEDNLEFAKNTIVLFDVFVKNVYHAATIEEAETLLQDFSIDIIISDIKLKKENGLDFIQKFRTDNVQTPIIILSGHKDEDFLFQAIPLKLTAYLLKPIKYDELINALRLCSETITLYQNPQISLKENWLFNIETKTLEKEGEAFVLNKKEALFMELIAHNRDRLITKEMIHASVWEFEEMSDSAVTNFILRIRRRFGKTFIYTIPDLGYRFSL
jgi:two-component system response regulator VanR